MSSPGFRDRNHQGDFESYVQGYEDMNLCSAQPTKVNTIKQNDRFALVNVRVTYRYRLSALLHYTYNFRHSEIHHYNRVVFLPHN